MSTAHRFLAAYINYHYIMRIYTLYKAQIAITTLMPHCYFRVNVPAVLIDISRFS